MVANITLTAAIWVCLVIAIVSFLRHYQGNTVIDVGGFKLRTRDTSIAALFIALLFLAYGTNAGLSPLQLIGVG